MQKPEIIIRWNDTVTNATGWLVIDRLIYGVCGGGTFMHPSATEKEVIDLARTMSYKNALQRIPFGGAKAGIRYDHTLPDANGVLARFLQYLEPFLQNVWCTGSDLNTTNAALQIIVRTMGLTSTFDALGKMVAHHAGVEDQSGKMFSRMTQKMTPYFAWSEGATGYSVALIMEMICQGTCPRIFIQGFGAVGRSLSYFIQERNIGKIVGISDVDGFLVAEDGINSVEILNAFYSASENNPRMDGWLNQSLKKKYNYKKRNADDNEAYIIEALASTHVDVFSPCASRYAVTEKVSDALARENNFVYIIPGANNIFDCEKTRMSAMRKGVHSFPEWISNSGNALLYEELLGLAEMPTDYSHFLREAIRNNILSFLEEAGSNAGEPTRWHDQFIRVAEERLARCREKPYVSHLMSNA